MGARQSRIPTSEAEQRAHKEAEKALKEARAKLALQDKVLLLGAGDSGKSTVLKQMRLIHSLNFTPREIESFRQLIFNNITFGLKLVLEAMHEMGLSVAAENERFIEVVENPPDLRDGEPYPVEFLEPLRALWNDNNVRRARDRGNEVALPENLTYFFSDLDRFFSSYYHPTEQDIIRCRVRTMGISETTFNVKNREMVMVDVGGQKSERRKWIHCFEGVTCVLYLASLSGYDQCLVEDRNINQMEDSMMLWQSICHSPWFKKTSLILFLNKEDLFKQKIAHSPIRNVFPDYEGEPDDLGAARAYFKRRFVKLSRGAPGTDLTERNRRQIYAHFTNATDTALLRMVMSVVEDITVRANLADQHLL